MKNLTILVDMDDSIENLSEAWVNYLNVRYGTSVKASEITDWDVSKAFPSLNSEDVYGVLREEGLWKTVKPLPGAVKYLKKLIDDGNQVYIVTASHPDTVSVKMNNVLFKYFPFIPYQNVIVASKKQLISGDILVDDALHNMGGHYTGLFFTAPHNRAVTDDQLAAVNAVRVENWKEVYELIHGYQTCERGGVNVSSKKRRVS